MPKMEIRDAVDSDWAAVWGLLQQSVAPGGTYYWPPDTSEEGMTDSLVRSSPLAELAVTKPGFQCQSLDSAAKKQVNVDGRPAKHHIDAKKVVAARMIST